MGSDRLQYSSTASPAAEQPDSPEIRSVLESECFAKSPSLRTLLLYLWEHRDQPISEYAIATEALGRSALFDSKTDATVRVQISRLRQRLEKYNERERPERSGRVVVPLGSHQIQVEPVPAELEAPAALAESRTPAQSPQRLIRVLVAVCALLLLCCAALLVVILHQTSPKEKQALPEFWKSFFGNGLPTRMVLPIPTFYGYSSAQGTSEGGIILRDTNINDFVRGLKSPAIQEMDRLLGKPSLNQAYTVTSDTFAAVTLTRYLDGFGVHLALHSSDDAVLEALDSENAIAIGTPGTLTPFSIYLNQLEFKLIDHETVVVDRSSANGVVFSRVPEAEGRSIWPGLIAVMPTRNPRVHLLILAGRYTSALVTVLTSGNGLNQLQEMWRANQSPEFYEAVIAADMNGNQLVKVRPVVLRPFTIGRTE